MHINMKTKRSCQVTASICLLVNYVNWKRRVRNQNLNKQVCIGKHADSSVLWTK